MIILHDEFSNHFFNSGKIKKYEFKLDLLKNIFENDNPIKIDETKINNNKYILFAFSLDKLFYFQKNITQEENNYFCENYIKFALNFTKKFDCIVIINCIYSKQKYKENLDFNKLNNILNELCKKNLIGFLNCDKIIEKNFYKFDILKMELEDYLFKFIDNFEKQFGFIVPSYCANEIHLRQLLRCIKSIRQYYLTNKIIIIDDYSNFNLKEYFDDDNIIIKLSLNKGSADMQTFKIFLENYLFDKAIIMQDSFILENELININDIIDVKFLWHFTNHKHHWDIILEPRDDFNINNNIVSHTDLIKFNIKKDFAKYPNFCDYALYNLDNKYNWVGCFGCLCVISKNCLIHMNKTLNFVDKFVNCTSNRDRRSAESIFSLICHFIFRERNFFDSVDGLYYDGINTNSYNNIETGFDNLKYCCKNFYFSKISFNR